MESRGSATRTVTVSSPTGGAHEVQPDFVLPERWKLARALGRGGQASVWLAHDEQLDDWVAIKVIDGPLDPVRMERLRREVNLGRSLSHKNLLRVYELMDLGDHLAVVMEWVEGGSLRDRLEQGPFPVSEVISVADQVLDVLAHMHDRGVVHRDIKPSNLLLDGDGAVRLADLGLARPVDDSRSLTRTQMTPGTPRYMSPEQIRGLQPSASGDLYSLGVTLYQLLTGAPPFTGSSDFDVADQHLRRQVIDPRRHQSDCPRWLARFIRRLLEKDPSDRWPDAGAALVAFRKRRAALSPRARRRAVAVVLMVVLGLGAGWTISVARDRSPATIGYDDQGIVARTQTDKILWRKSFDRPPQNWAIADFLGEGQPQVALGFDFPFTMGDGMRPQIVLLSADGEVYREISLGSAFAGAFPQFDSRWARVRVASQDIDGDGRANLIWWARHRAHFPAIVGTWLPDVSTPGHNLFLNSGHVQGVKTADLDGDGLPEIVINGINNRLGFQTFVAILRSEEGVFSTEKSPDKFLDGVVRMPHITCDYTVVGPFRGEQQILEAGPDGISLGPLRRQIHLDRDGNPAGSKLDGAGWSARRAFWLDLGASCYGLASGQAGPERSLAIFDRHPEVLSEEPMEVAAVLMLARALAMSGNLPQAAFLLEQSVPNHRDYSDLQLRLGEYSLMQGRRQQGRLMLEKLLHDPDGRGAGDARIFLVLEAAVSGDEQQFARMVDIVLSLGVAGAEERCLTETRTLWAFCRGSWADEALDPGQRDWAMQELSVFRLWAAIHRGEDAATIAEQAHELGENPEIAAIAGLLEAECLVRTGRPQRALPMAEKYLRTLQPLGRWQYEKYVWVPLAHHVVAVAAEAVGDIERARTHREQAKAMAPNCWFGEGKQER